MIPFSLYEAQIYFLGAEGTGIDAGKIDDVGQDKESWKVVVTWRKDALPKQMAAPPCL